MPSTLEAARAAKEGLRRELLSGLDVVGIGIEKVPDGFGLKVNLRRRPRNDKSMPSSYNGVPVRYEVVGTIRAFSGGTTAA